MRNEDRIIAKLVEIDHKVDVLAQTMVTRDEFEGRIDGIMTVLDHHTVMFERLDQERIVMTARVGRLEDAVFKS